MRDLRGLKVCFIAGTLGQGGAERQLYYMLRTLCHHGARPRVLCLTRGEYWQAHIEALGVRVTWVGQSASRVQRLRRIVQELFRDRPAIVQSQHFYTNMYAATAARLLGLREIGALRSDGTNEVGANCGPLGWASLRIPRMVAANSGRGIENAVRLGATRSRLHFLPNVVDGSHFALSTRAESATVTVLTVGRMVPPKRFDRFLRVLAAARSRSRVPIRGVLVGDGPLRPNIVATAQELGLLPDGLDLRGAISNVAQLYREADILVLSSDWEGTPNVVLEAMACGLPVAATRVGGVDDVVRHCETGLIVAPEDEEGLADAVVQLAEDTARRMEYGQRGRALIEDKYMLPRLQSELQQLYDRVLS